MPWHICAVLPAAGLSLAVLSFPMWGHLLKNSLQGGREEILQQWTQRSSSCCCSTTHVAPEVGAIDVTPSRPQEAGLPALTSGVPASSLSPPMES